MSTFSSLEVARRALSATQSAIQTTGNNIANADTDGYTRQRVNLATTAPYPSPSFNQPMTPGQLGTGVEAGSVQRIRENFTDIQVRSETTQSGYYTAQSDAMSKMEDIMNEPTDQGLSNSLTQFWQSLQDLSANPEDDGARSVVRQQGQALTETFNYLSSSLTSVRNDLKSQTDVTVSQINSLAAQINQVNQQISAVEPNGMLPNDLYDKRDSLVDQLSELANVKVIQVPNGGNKQALAEGNYTVQLVDTSGNTYTLVDGSNLEANKLNVAYNQNNDISTLTIDGMNVPSKAVGGKLQGLMDSYSNDYPNMLNELDTMAYHFANAFNQVHEQGYGQDGQTTGTPFFFTPLTTVTGAAQAITVNPDIMNNKSLIAAAGPGHPGESGDNTNALALSNVITDPISFGSKNVSIQDYLKGVVGDMGVKAQEASRMQSNTDTLKSAAEDRRTSVSGVSIDEEMTNLIKYQQAYNASAKMISTINDMLNTLINSIGN